MKVFGQKRAACRLAEQKYRSQFQYAHLEYVVLIIGSYEGDAWKLTWEHRVIPFDTPYRLISDETVIVDNSCSIHEFKPFGSGRATNEGVPAYNFKNEQERHQAILLAIEAFLTYKSRLPRRETIDCLYRVEYDGKEYRMSDFDAPKT